jgi:hypothetical protein
MILHVTDGTPENKFNFRALVFMLLRYLPNKQSKKIALFFTLLYLATEFAFFATFVARRIANILGIKVLTSTDAVLALAKKKK